MDLEEQKYIAEKQMKFLKHIDLYAALAELPEKQHEAVMMWVEGLSFEEIGKVLEISPQAAWTRVQRAIESLRTLMDAV